MALLLVLKVLVVQQVYAAAAPSPAKCPFPTELLHGEVVLLGQTPGSKMTFSCDQGYWREGPEESTCQPDGRWSGGKVTCHVVKCPLLPNPQYGAVILKGQGQGDKLTVQCKPGYVYTGTLPRVCQANNTWSGHDGICIHRFTEICPVVEAPDHGEVNMTGLGYNDSMMVTCEEDYWYTGSPVRVCQGDGHWSGKAGVCQQNVNKGSQSETSVALIVVPVLLAVLLIAVTAVCLFLYRRRRRPSPSSGDHSDVNQGKPLLDSSVSQEKQMKRDFSDKEQKIIDNLSLDEVLQVFEIGENVKNDIRQAGNSEEQVQYLLKNIDKPQTEDLYRIIAGIQPDLFQKVKGREPTEEEKDFCLHNYAKCLRTKITETGHVPDRKFDAEIPDLLENFIALHLVNDCDNSKKIDRIDKQLINVRDILSPPVSASEIDSAKKNSHFILIKGRAGVGKTTLLQYLATLWAKGDWGQQFTVIFLLKMREIMSLTETMTLKELLLRHSFYKTNKTIPTSWIHCNPERIAIMIDGIDEYGNLTSGIFNTEEVMESTVDKSALTFCFNIINRNLMDSSTLIITSRPLTALAHLKPTQQIEVVGLSEEKITEYINSSFPEAASTKIFRILQSMPHLMSLCQITFYCMAFCRIFGEEDEELHELNTYTSIMAFVILKHACRHQRRTENPGIGELVGGAKPYLPALAKLAYRGLKPSADGVPGINVVFTQRDFRNIDIPEDSHQTGLIYAETITSAVGHKETYTEFAHLCIQEFLGMAHIAWDNDEIKGYLQTEGLRDDAMLTVPFLFGLVYNTNNKWIRAVLEALGHDETSEDGSIPKQTIKEFIKETCKKFNPENTKGLGERKSLNHRITKLCLLAYEAQCVEMAQDVATAIAGKTSQLHLKGMAFTAMEVNAIIFVIGKGRDLKSLKLENCHLDEACFHSIAKYVTVTPHLTELDLSQNKISLKTLMHLTKAIRLKRRLTKLMLDDCELDNKCIKEITNLLADVPSIIHLDINRNVFGDEALEDLADHVSCSQSLTHLSIVGMRSNITDKGAMCMAKALRENTSLKELFSINDNSLTDDGVIALADALRENKNINVRRIGLATFEMTDEGAEAVIKLTKEKTPQLVRVTDGNLSETMRAKLKDMPRIAIYY